MSTHTDLRPVTDTAPGAGVIMRTADYGAAVRAVDNLSDAGFPVEQVQIVGRGLQSVEQVTGRMTKARAALAGAATGAWFGLFVGLLFSLFLIGPAWWGMVLWSVIIGAVFGGLFGFVGHWATRGRRDFSSIQALRADEYEIVVDAAYVDEAVDLLQRR